MDTDLVCWKCGAVLEDVPLPIGRLAECPSCHGELHVCVSCAFHDTKVAKQCRETIAEEVKDKTRANFCDYFQLRPNAYRLKDETAAQAARDELEALFGGATARAAPEGGAAAEPEQAREELERLFKKPRKDH